MSNQQTEPSVNIVRKTNVYPKCSQPEKLLILSSLDRQCPLLMYLVFFYKPEKTVGIPIGSVFDGLKTGLEETLSVWYPAAGRLRMDQKDGFGELNLWCNNGGAVMVEAVTRVEISEFGDLSRYDEFFETLVYKPEFCGDFSELPLVVAQVTRFGCGGYSIGIGTSHSLFDGISAYDFLNSWASNSNKNNKITEPVINPVHERDGLLSLTKPNRVVETRAAAIDHLYQLIGQSMAGRIVNCEEGHGQNGNLDKNLRFVLKTFELNFEDIKGLKKKLIGEKELKEMFSCSSFEFLAAHLWKARTKAIGVRKEAMVCLQFPVDIRRKLNPPLQKEFSGNGYVLASVSSTAGELYGQAIETTINKIREAKRSINQDYVTAYVETLNNNNNDGNLPPIEELTMVSDWTRMSFHNAAFVNGVPADHVVPLFPPLPQVAYLMKNPNDDEGIHVRIGLREGSIKGFSNYFVNGF